MRRRDAFGGLVGYSPKPGVAITQTPDFFSARGWRVSGGGGSIVHKGRSTVTAGGFPGYGTIR